MCGELLAPFGGVLAILVLGVTPGVLIHQPDVVVDRSSLCAVRLSREGTGEVQPATKRNCRRAALSPANFGRRRWRRGLPLPGASDGAIGCRRRARAGLGSGGQRVVSQHRTRRSAILLIETWRSAAKFWAAARAAGPCGVALRRTLPGMSLPDPSDHVVRDRLAVFPKSFGKMRFQRKKHAGRIRNCFRIILKEV